MSISYDKRFSYSSIGWRRAPDAQQRLQPRKPLRESLAHHMLEVVVQRVRRGDREVRQVVLVALEIDLAALGNAQRVGQRVGHLAEHLLHLRRGLQVELIAVIAQAIAIVDRLAGADAEKNVVRAMVAVRQVMHVVGCNERHVQLAGDRHEPLVHDQLLVDALILHLEEEVPLRRECRETARRLRAPCVRDRSGSRWPPRP